MGRGFVWRDVGRTVVFGDGGVGRASEILADRGIAGFELITTARALSINPGAADASPRSPSAQAPPAAHGPATQALVAAADRVHEIGPGQVPDLAAPLLQVVELRRALRGEARQPTLVALGGGRVIDVAKAVASVVGAEVVAIPTTMSGAEMTAIHRLPAGAEADARGQVRPRLVIADPGAMTSQPEAALRASSTNALAHGADSLYTPLANPIAEHAAIRGAGLIAAVLDRDPEDRDDADLALGSVLCGYAIDSAGLGLHHVICQTLVRLCGTPHAETNAAILPPALAFLAGRAPEPLARLADALGTDLDALAPRVRDLGRPAALAPLATRPESLETALAAMLERPELAHVPGPPLTRGELADIVAPAWQ